jgi:cobalamin biosynthesis Mg chelatase CobN
VANVRPESEIAPPSKKAKFGHSAKDARAAKVAKKAAKKAARQAERKARAQSSNKAAIRAMTAAAKGRRLDATGASTTARADGRTTGHSPISDEGRRAGDSQRPKRTSRRSPAQPSGGMRALSTAMLILVAAVLVFAALGWFLAARH